MSTNSEFNVSNTAIIPVINLQGKANININMEIVATVKFGLSIVPYIGLGVYLFSPTQ